MRNSRARHALYLRWFVPNQGVCYISSQNELRPVPSSCRHPKHGLTSARMMRAICIPAGLAVALAGATLRAQPSGPTVTELEQRLNACSRLVRDWAGLTRYG